MTRFDGEQLSSDGGGLQGGSPTGPTDDAASQLNGPSTSVTLFSLSASTTYWIVVDAHQITSSETSSAKPARTTVVTTRATTANYYVDAANGSDANAGTSDAPWKTITYARTIALAGDTINVRRGK